MENAEFRRVAIEPLECLRESWRRLGDQYWLFLGITFVGLVIGGAVPFGILMGAMMCGIYLCYLQRWRGERVRFESLFRGFDHFVDSLIANLVMVGIGMILVIGFVVVGSLAMLALAGVGASTHEGGPVVALSVAFWIIGVLLLVTAVTVLHSFFSFAFLLIVDRKLPGLQAVKRSAEAVVRNLGGMLGLALLNMLLSLLGMCACYVGALFVLPVTFGAIVAAYDKVFGIASAPPLPAEAVPAPPTPAA